jgi:acetylornithine deacetylase
MISPEQLSARATEELARLVAFDTTSRLSNLALIEHVEGLLGAHGIASRRVANADGRKANLYATVGPAVEGGVVLSGHTDVVPVDGQAWSSHPFTLTERDGKLFGRGTCDMKSFIALALAAVPDFVAAGLKRPVHFAWSYDEEVGCLGAPDMIREIAAQVPRPLAVIVGEPTGMEAVNGHKGIRTFTVRVTGKEAHSSRTDLGASAVMAAVRLMAVLEDTAQRLKREADPHSPFHPKETTLTIGVVNGGTAGNILARECSFLFDLRAAAGFDAERALAPFFAAVEAEDAALKRWGEACGVTVERRSSTPPLSPEPNGAAEALARVLAGDNGPARAVAFAAEAGQFQEAGFSTVICGPGSIDQAHQPDEFVEISQLQRGAAFMARLAEHLAS